MKEKLERGEYRSAQAMQKDFILVMQNCITFNSPNSDIVKDARQQALMRPSILRKAAEKHNLFLGEDGKFVVSYCMLRFLRTRTSFSPDAFFGVYSFDLVTGTVLEIVDEEEKAEKVAKKTRKPRKSATVKKKADPDTEEAPPKKRRSRKKEAEDAVDEDPEAEADTKAKPRLKLRMGKKKDDDAETGKRKRRRRKINTPPAVEDADADNEIATPVPRRKRKKANTPEAEADKETKKARAVDSDDDKPLSEILGKENGKGADKSENSNNGEIFLDVDYWKAEQEKLDGSFLAARALFTKHGPWKLPDATTERKFRLIAKSTLVKMDKHDGYDVFTEPVSDSEAPGYSETIKEPMDFSTMRSKIEKKEYGQGNEAFEKFYKDFLLTFDNCHLYNDDQGEVVNEAARLFGLLPESFAAAAAAVVKSNKT